MRKTDLANFGPFTVVIRDIVTRRQARIEVSHPEGKCVFEYDDSSERGDQLRNAVFFAHALETRGGVNKIVEYITDPNVPHRVTVIDRHVRWNSKGA